MMDDMKKKAAMEALQELISQMMGIEGKVEDPVEEMTEGESNAMEDQDKPAMMREEVKMSEDEKDLDDEKKEYMRGSKKLDGGKTGAMIMMNMTKSPLMKKGKKVAC